MNIFFSYIIYKGDIIFLFYQVCISNYDFIIKTVTLLLNPKKIFLIVLPTILCLPILTEGYLLHLTEIVAKIIWFLKYN